MNITKRNVLITMLILSLAVFSFASAFNVNGKEVTFKDFQDSHWAYQNVKVLVEAGAIGGYPDGSFKPSGTITNAEFIKIATVQAGFDGKAEAGAAWYKPYVDFAYDKGIIEKGIFSDNAWNKPITRDKMCYVIARVGEYLGEDFSYSSDVLSGMNSAVVDVAGMTEPYKTCVYKALSKGIVTGYANNKSFEPTWNATRAEAAAMLSRLSDKSLRATTHFVSTVVKVDKDFISKMDKKWDTKGMSPANSLHTVKNISLKELLRNYAEGKDSDKIDRGNKYIIYFDNDNESGCTVCPDICYDAGDNKKDGFFAYADKTFFKQRGTFIPILDDDTDYAITTFFFYKDGTTDASSNSYSCGYGQNINNIDIVVFEVLYTNKSEVWVIDNPTILSYQTETMKALTSYAWWR